MIHDAANLSFVVLYPLFSPVPSALASFSLQIYQRFPAYTQCDSSKAFARGHIQCVIAFSVEEVSFSIFRSSGQKRPTFSQVPGCCGDVARKAVCFQQGNTPSGTSINRLIVHYTLIFFYYLFFSRCDSLWHIFMVESCARRKRGA
jgi:hypothetical protein